MPPSAKAWLELADRIVDGFDRASGLYEQFRGFFALEPVKIVELATRPLSGEVFLGRDRVAGTQCVKQPDVLMLYHLVPDGSRPRDPCGEPGLLRSADRFREFALHRGFTLR